MDALTVYTSFPFTPTHPPTYSYSDRSTFKEWPPSLAECSIRCLATTLTNCLIMQKGDYQNEKENVNTYDFSKDSSYTGQENIVTNVGSMGVYIVRQIVESFTKDVTANLLSRLCPLALKRFEDVTSQLFGSDGYAASLPTLTQPLWRLHVMCRWPAARRESTRLKTARNPARFWRLVEGVPMDKMEETDWRRSFFEYYLQDCTFFLSRDQEALHPHFVSVAGTIPTASETPAIPGDVTPDTCLVDSDTVENLLCTCPSRDSLASHTFMHAGGLTETVRLKFQRTYVVPLLFRRVPWTLSLCGSEITALKLHNPPERLIGELTRTVWHLPNLKTVEFGHLRPANVELPARLLAAYPYITHLTLHHLKLDDTHTATLLSHLANTASARQILLENVDLISFRLGRNGAIELSRLLNQCRQIRAISLDGTGLCDADGKVLIAGLESAIAGSEGLKIAIDDSNIGALTTSALSTLMGGSNGSHLTEIILTDCGLDEDTILPLCTALKSSANHLRVLGLGHNPIGSDGALLLAEALPYMGALTRLGLSACEISTKACAFLITRGLTSCHSLRSLSMAENPLGAGIDPALASLLTNVNLVSLNISFCRLGDGVFPTPELSSALGASQSLSCLCIAGNRLGDNGAQRLSKALAGPHLKLTALDLHGNCISEVGLGHIVSALHATGQRLTAINITENQLLETVRKRPRLDPDAPQQPTIYSVAETVVVDVGDGFVTSSVADFFDPR